MFERIKMCFGLKPPTLTDAQIRDRLIQMCRGAKSEEELRQKIKTLCPHDPFVNWTPNGVLIMVHSPNGKELIRAQSKRA